jgi:ribosome modulation factor
MAPKIQSATIHPISSAKPKGRAKAKAKPAAAAAPPEDLDGVGEEVQRAPAFGSNEPDEGVFLRWVNELERHEEKGEALKLAVTNWRKERKTKRAEAQAAGLVMGQLDQAIAELKTEQTDLLAQQLRLDIYRGWLDLPVLDRGQKGKALAEKISPDDEKAKWKKRGSQAGRLGKSRDLPEGIPPECIQPWLKGWDAGQEALMHGSPLTKGAFDGKTTAPAKEQVHHPKVLQLDESHFSTDTTLEEANMKTLLRDYIEHVGAAETVTVVFGQARRILKEPDADAPGGFYLDTGESDVPVTDPEPVDAADL